MRHLILGTAGHVDHGKTELVRALTGRDTDRLKEEKERGISIELGFAPLALDDDTFLGIVDVPGHERFVKHMVAGAGGLDLAMLLVAADEGVSPQTEEHIEVLQALSIPAGLVVISKQDLATEETREILDQEIADLVRGTFLEGAPVVATSARTGEGLDTLRRVLRELAGRVKPRDTAGPFRQPVDRVFHRKGIGVVITGSCYSGTVRVGDTLELMPAGRKTRVRELQSFGEKRPEGYAGERLAIALQGVRLEEVSRGDMLVTPGRFSASNAIDARVRLADYFDFELKNRERVRIHHGAREVLGRVILLETDLLRPGESTLAQLALESPLVSGAGDHIVLRKYSPARVIGGGTVIDPDPPRHKRGDGAVIEKLELSEKGDPLAVVRRGVADAGLAGINRASVDPALLGELIEDGSVIDVEGVLFAAPALVSLSETVEDLAEQHLGAHPLAWGIDKEELRQRCAFPHPTGVFNRVLEKMGTMRPIYVRGSRVRSGTPDIVLDDAAREEVGRLRDRIAAAGIAFASRAEFEDGWDGRHKFPDVVQFLKDSGEVVEVGDGGLIHSGALKECVAVLARLFEEGAEVSIPQIKDALGLTRKHTIPLVEMLDAAGVTARVGNARVRGPRFPGPWSEDG